MQRYVQVAVDPVMVHLVPLSPHPGSPCFTATTVGAGYNDPDGTRIVQANAEV